MIVRLSCPRINSQASSRSYSAPVDGAIPAAKQRFVPKEGTYPKGFRVSGTHVGVKASNTGLPDLAIIASDRPCSGAAVFTRNKFQAAPVVVSRQVLVDRSGEGIRGIVINAGCANAVTGKGGMEDAHAMGSVLNSQFSPIPSPSAALVMSTGVIGQRLPIDKITSAIPKGFSALASNHESWLLAARAICTTDTFPKLLSQTFTLPSNSDVKYSLAGMTKGAGMIQPNMATLLGIICTDAPIPAKTLDLLLRQAAKHSFNAISVDGDTSTNDTLALLANGAAGGTPLTAVDSADGQAMGQILTAFSQKLSQLVVRDGEGATKFVHIRVINAPQDVTAWRVARNIANSPLVKTALYGKDANWGRILCAIGSTETVGAEGPKPEQTSVSFVATNGEHLRLVTNGEPEALDEAKAAELLAEEDVEILVDLGFRDTDCEPVSFWTCDFSHEYVTINGDYRT